MALNRVRAEANQLNVPVASGITAGEFVLVGDLPAVALTDRDADGNATVQLDGSFSFPVSIAVAVGDVVYDHSGTVNKTSAGGSRMGIAVSSVPSGGGDIEIKLAK